jgi:protein subunit release factor A
MTTSALTVEPMRKHIFKITIEDCKVQTFRAGGKGGQNQNKRNSGVRVIHPPSGAVGESREGRGQLENKRKAFGRMGRTPEFQTWAKMKAMGLEPVEDIVERQMHPDNLTIECGPFGE